MVGNSYIHPNSNQNNLHPPLELSCPTSGSASLQLGSNAWPLDGNASKTKAMTSNSPTGKHPKPPLKVRF